MKTLPFQLYYIVYFYDTINKIFTSIFNLACGIWHLPWNWLIGTRHSRVPGYKNQKREILSKTSSGWRGTATTAGMIYTQIGLIKYFNVWHLYSISSINSCLPIPTQQLTGTDHDSDKLDSDQEASTGSPLLRKRWKY